MYALDRRLDGPQNRPGRRGEKKILDPTRIFDGKRMELNGETIINKWLLVIGIFYNPF
jgi:hypothetical protein